MTEVASVSLVLAMAQPAQGNQSVWVTLLPFVLMLGIFYVLVLLPMRKRQKKVQDFQAGLKVGDRVILTSGLYGQITRLGEASVRVQIADKVQVEVSRAAVGGYQGQEPVVQPEAGSGGS
jgi:preprotein translocase subunit YajC